jgi:hypothetical protein
LSFAHQPSSHYLLPKTITWLNRHPNAIGLIAGRCGTRLIDRLLCPRASGTNILHLETDPVETTGTETAIAGDTEADHLVSLQAEVIEGITDAGIGMTEVTEIIEAGATGEVRLSRARSSASEREMGLTYIPA